MTRRRVAWILVAGLAVAALAATGASLLAGARPLRTAGAGSVSGATASASFTIGRATIRQIRYADRQRIGYSFTLVNTSPVPLRVAGVVPDARRPTLLRLRGLTPVTLAAGARHRVTLRILMTGCERLSARAGSVVTRLRLRIRVLGVIPRTVTVPLAEQLRVGSAREASCPRATSHSRPPG